MKNRPRVFIGSSSEGISYANAIQQLLVKSSDVVVWNQGFFKANVSTLDNLINQVDEFDFAIFIFTPDDIINIRNNEHKCPRDNVIFEYGIFIGKLGKERSFHIIPYDLNGIHLPSDLFGITAIQYNSYDQYKQSAVGPACTTILEQIQKLGCVIRNDQIQKTSNYIPISEDIRASLLEKVKKYGLVDIALDRKDIDWKFSENNIQSLIENIPNNSEIFIVARSMERWVNTSEQLLLLGRRIVRDGLKVDFVIPDPNINDLTSLVKDDPAQKIQKFVWERLNTELRNIIEREFLQLDEETKCGHLRVYGIPAYVPDTFASYVGRKNVKYCTLEVGIGVQGQERVFLLFKDTCEEMKIDIYKKLNEIYRSITRSRTPILQVPDTKFEYIENRKNLISVYNKFETDFLRAGISYEKSKHRKEFYDDNNSLLTGESQCIMTLPFSSYVGGNKLCEKIDEIKTSFNEFFTFNSIASVIKWEEIDKIHIPIFHIKRGFKGKLTKYELHNDNINKIIDIFSKFAPFKVSFERICIDSFGTIMLLGFVDLPILSNLRDSLSLCFEESNGFNNTFRPNIINCVIGRITNYIPDYIVPPIQDYFNRNINIKINNEILIDAVRVIKLSGNLLDNVYSSAYDTDFITFSEKAIDDQSILKNLQSEKLWNKEKYGEMSTSKWLAHENQFKSVIEHKFYDINPVMAHLAPSLLCNCSCPFCSYGKIKGKFLRQKHCMSMSKENLYSTINSLKSFGIKSIIFTGGGEPLMNENTLDAIDYATNSLNMSVALFTNGLLLDDIAINDIVSANPHFIRISINGSNSEIYNLMHGFNLNETKYKDLLKNIEKLAMCKNNAIMNKKFSRDPFKINIGVLISPFNYDSIMHLAVDLKKIISKYPGMINNIAFRPTVRYKNGCQDKENDSTKRILNYIQNADLFEVQEYYRIVKSFIDSDLQFPDWIFNKAINIIENEIIPFFSKEDVSINIPTERIKGINNKKHPFNECLACSWVTKIGPDTTIYHCVENAFDEDMSYGKLTDFDFDFSKIWAGDARKNVIQKLKANINLKCPPICLLYEYNCIFNVIDKALSDTTKEESVIHDLKRMKQKFLKNYQSDLGKNCDFI